MKIALVSGGLAQGSARCILIGLSSSFLCGAAYAETPVVFSYETLNFGTDDTFLTGIRGSNIVGNYTIPGTTETGGLYYNLATATWAPMPASTPNGANFPGAIGSSPYGPSFGTPGGVLRVVGSYQTATSAPYDLSYLYDAAAAPGETIRTLIYPGSETLYTIAHSTFGNLVVGNYDTRLATGNAFIYDIDTGTYTTNNIPGTNPDGSAISTTAYGIYGDKIAGGYGEVMVGGGIHAEHGYIYDRPTGTYTTYDHPGAIATHFEGITGAGRSGEYNLVTNWITPDGAVHPAVMHLAADGSTRWYEIDIPGGNDVSSNSAYGDHVIGVYLANGRINGYVASMPGLYNPIRNTGTLTSDAENAAALSGRKGDDIVNSGSVSVSGNGGIGLRGETYGVIDNAGTVTATGIAGAAAEMHGLYGTLLNSGTLQTAFVADALRTGPDATGTVIVNTGVIDGRLAATAGLGKRFENSGWLGISGTGLPVMDLFGGTFVQTAAGTLSLRMTDDGNDSLGIAGTARLAGTLDASFQTTALDKTYAILGATEAVTGRFETLTVSGLPDLFAAGLSYSPTSVTLDVAADLAGAGATPNERAVGSALDRFINVTGDNSLAPLPDALQPLYALSRSQLPEALGAMSGEGYASEQTVLAGDSRYSRQAVLGRLRQGALPRDAGALGTIAGGGPVVAAPAQASSGATLWGEAYGAWGNLDATGGAAAVSESIGGIISGVDMSVDNWLVGAALGYSQSNASIDALGTDFTTDSLLVALYAGTTAGPWAMRFGASYAFNQIEADRTIAYPGYLALANAQSDGGTAQAFAEIGYDVTVQRLALEPFAGLAYVDVSGQDYAETGASAGLAGSAGSFGVGYGTLGIRAASTLPLGNGMVLQPRAALAWQYAFGDTAPDAQFAFLAAPGASFSVSGMPVAENTALIEFGADLLVSPKAKLGLSYTGQFAEAVSDNAVEANFSWSF